MAFWSRAGKRDNDLPTYIAKQATLYSDEQKGASRCITMYLDKSGALKLEGQDVGSKVSEMFGDSDYEFAVRLSPDSTAALCFALLKDRLSGRSDAVDALRELCKEEGVDCEFANWM